MEAIEAVVERLMSRLIAQHEIRENQMWDERIARSFPDGDMDAHCDYHQDLIDSAQAQKQFWVAAQTKLMEKGIDGLFSVLKIVLMLAVAGLAVKVGVALPFLGGK
jgi:hypothetical protein